MKEREKNTVKKILETVNQLPPREQEKILWLGQGMALAQGVGNGKK